MSQAERLEVIDGEGQPVAQDGDDPLVGQTIDGRYEVERVLGEGGMGLVYKARHTVLGKPLALKVLRPDVSKDEEIITRFRQEAQSASSIGNEHIIDISDFGTLTDGSTYFVMEFLDGVDLTGAIEGETPMRAARVVHIAKQMCRALAAAHDIGIVHRDLKPDNIFLVKRGGDSDFVKVLDFGIAKVGGNASKLTRAGQVFGTPHYMSPEQCSGSGVDHRTDIYAIGIILYEMATGQVPFDADNLMGILTKHLYEEAIAPREVNPELPEGLETVILKCITKNADQRYQTMSEVMADLEQLEAGLAPYAVRPDPTGRMALSSGDTQAMQAPVVAGGRSRMMAIGIGAGALVLAAVAGAVVMSSGGDSAEAEEEALLAEEALAEDEADAVPEDEVAAAEEIAAQPQAEEQGARDTARVTIESDPPGAEVLLGQDFIGNAPVKVPRPEEGERVELKLRLADHKTQTLRISHLTAEAVKVSLEQEEKQARPARRTTRRPSRAQQQRQKQQQQAQEPAAKPRKRPSALPQTEVLDPWAN
jgi:eukaryotic-like serine/threonine-protein kinase